MVMLTLKQSDTYSSGVRLNVIKPPIAQVRFRVVRRTLTLRCQAECHQAPHSTGKVQGGEKDTDTQVSS